MVTKTVGESLSAFGPFNRIQTTATYSLLLAVQHEPTNKNTLLEGVTLRSVVGRTFLCMSRTDLEACLCILDILASRIKSSCSHPLNNPQSVMASSRRYFGDVDKNMGAGTRRTTP